MAMQARPVEHSTDSTRACALIRECIAEVRSAAMSPRKLRLTPLPLTHTPSELFRQDVRNWLLAVQRARSRNWHAGDAWFDAFKLHLNLLVGPRAASELGRQAGPKGLQILACEFRTLFGIDVPPRATSLLDDEEPDTDANASVAATLHALPTTMRCSPHLVTRLLALVVSLSASVPFDEQALKHLSELRRLHP